MWGGCEGDTKQRPETRSRLLSKDLGGTERGQVWLGPKSPQELGPGQGGGCPGSSDLSPWSERPGKRS